jgi:hypothetical protein
MKEKLLDLLGQLCFAGGSFLIFYIVIDWFFTWINFEASPQRLLCLITGAAMGFVGLAMLERGRRNK